MRTRDDIRNIAIVARVDHGKTTPVNEMLKQSSTLPEHFSIEDRAMDTNAIEREHGITILSKNTAVKYNNHQINILDTPGHVDFGGKVERAIKMVDGVLLVVDAFERTMPQTRFVLKRTPRQHLTPIVVINKVDRKGARPEEVVDEILDLLIELGADEDQLDFPAVYTSATNDASSYDSDVSTQEYTMKPLFDTIIRTIPAPMDDSDEPLQPQVAILNCDDFVGRIGIGRVFRDKIKVDDNVTLMRLDGPRKDFRVTKLFSFFGLERLEINEAEVGDLAAASGMGDVNIGETVADAECPEAVTPLRVDPSALQITFRTNDSPSTGREGRFIAARQLEDRLKREMQTDMSLKVGDTDDPDARAVSGRGESHLSILVETLRREGYELSVSRPQVTYHEIDGVVSEPFEEVQIGTPGEYTGAVIDSLSKRKGEMKNMEPGENGQTRLTFLAPSRDLIGCSTEFMTMTRGCGVMNHTFEKYAPVIKSWSPGRQEGTLVSMNAGKATTYVMIGIESRGQLLIDPGTEAYEGMVVGENSRENDIIINATRGKNLTNVRVAGSGKMAHIETPTRFSLEESLGFLNGDEYCEVTPENVRLREKTLNTDAREKGAKRRRATPWR